MLRKSGGSITLLILPGALLTFGAPVVHAQAEPTDPAGVVGAPCAYDRGSRCKNLAGLFTSS